MSPQDAISALDRQLAQHGQSVTLRHQPDPNVAAVDVTLNAFVRDYRPAEIINGSGLAQGDTLITLSPKAITAANWPGSVTTSADKSVPTILDKIKVAGVWRKIKAPKPIYLGGTLVRIDLVAAA